MSGAPASLDKGKGRVTSPPEPDEHTPLIASSSHSHGVDPEVPQLLQYDRRSSFKTFFATFLALLLLSIGIAFGLFLLARSYAVEASKASPADVLSRAVTLSGPHSVDVLNTTTLSSGETEIWVEVSGDFGVDAGNIIGVTVDPEDGFLRSTWKRIGRWGIRKLDTVSVVIDTVTLSTADSETFIASVHIPPLNDIPLVDQAPHGEDWLTPIRLPVLLKPTPDAQTWLDFAQNSWNAGFVSVHMDIERVTINGGAIGESSWRKLLKANRKDVTIAVRHKSPFFDSLLSLRLTNF